MTGNEVCDILQELGLEDDEIKSISRRNKLLDDTTAYEVENIIDFFKIKCNLEPDDIASIIIENPLILSENFARINMLKSIYDSLGFSKEEYKKYVTNFRRAFSLNPKDVADSIVNMLNSGKQLADIRFEMLEKPNILF